MKASKQLPALYIDFAFDTVSNDYMNTRKHYEGCYRTKTVNGFFGQIKKSTAPLSIRERAGKWHAEIRRADGTLSQYCGIWHTKKSAINEVESVLNGTSSLYTSVGRLNDDSE